MVGLSGPVALTIDMRQSSDGVPRSYGDELRRNAQITNRSAVLGRPFQFACEASDSAYASFWQADLARLSQLSVLSRRKSDLETKEMIQIAKETQEAVERFRNDRP